MIVSEKNYDETLENFSNSIENKNDSIRHSDDTEIVKPPTYMLTTTDNPFHPLTEYDNWLRYDEDHGYYTQNYLARIAGTSVYLTDAENQMLINNAIDEICRLNILGIYKRIIVEE